MIFKNPKHQNLFKLAGYLLNLPKNYKHFDMASHVYAGDTSDYSDNQIELLLLNKVKVYDCGAVACAVGHCVDAGFDPVKSVDENWWSGRKDICIDWSKTAEKYFVDSISNDAWDWMFSGEWDRVDNTPHGAAMRICWYITNGLPDNWEDQMYGDAPLCYR